MINYSSIRTDTVIARQGDLELIARRGDDGIRFDDVWDDSRHAYIQAPVWNETAQAGIRAMFDVMDIA